jgi:hypothetical protein
VIGQSNGSGCIGAGRISLHVIRYLLPRPPFSEEGMTVIDASCMFENEHSLG